MPDFGNLLAEGLNAQVAKIQAPTLNIASTLATATQQLPIGTAVVPSTVSQAAYAQPIIIVQLTPITMDGRILSQGLMPYIADQIRYGCGTHGY